MERPDGAAPLTQRRTPARWRRWWAVTLLGMVALVAIALAPTQTKQGVDFGVSTKTLPL